MQKRKLNLISRDIGQSETVKQLNQSFLALGDKINQAGYELQKELDKVNEKIYEYQRKNR
jgi:hypothetical protein